jgi:hypothetical protein
MIAYDSYNPVGYSETKPDYEITRHSCTSVKSLSGDPQVFISWPPLQPISQMGRHEWICSKEYL